MDDIKLSVRELVEFVYKGGDLNNRPLSKDRAMEGIRAHKILQSDRGENYQKEFFLKYEFRQNNINFIIEGRADGIICLNNQITVDEIKSTYTNLEIIDENYNKAHLAQAKCYAYIYCVQNDIEIINVQLRYFNLESKNVKKILFEYKLVELENFFDELINRYMKWAELMLDSQKNRYSTINDLTFPFDKYRKGQREFSVAVYRTIKEGKKLYAQAPTGVGKTVSVLFPAIKALNVINNSKIYYLTAKSSTKTIAFNTVKKMAEKGLKLRTTVLTAKEKICFNEEFNCDPEFCPYAKGYYDRLNNILWDTISSRCLYDKDFIEKTAFENSICPFEFSLDLSYMSDVIICDYNYYFDPRVALQREDTLKRTNDILLIDEAHNLEERARNMYSPEIIKEEFYELYKKMRERNKKISKELYNINKNFIKLRKIADKDISIMHDNPDCLIKALNKFISVSEEYIDKELDILEEFMDIYFKALQFIKISEITDENFCYYIEGTGGKTKIKIFLINPSQILNKIENDAWASIFFSATLTPLKYFRYILGGSQSDNILKIKSPFERKNLKLMITADISMKYSLRELNIERACNYIYSSINEYIGNYMIFFPSYSYLNKAAKVYAEKYDTENIIIQDQSLNEDLQNDIINKFHNNTGIILFTVIGGVFSEGVDLPLEKLIGTVIIGTGIPKISFERDIIKNFFDEKFNCGFDYAYKYPGWNKILQSAGRVIRTEEDRGTVLLMDSRICQDSYLRLFPEHWRNYKKIYRPLELIEQIKLFWSERRIK